MLTLETLWVKDAVMLGKPPLQRAHGLSMLTDSKKPGFYALALLGSAFYQQTAPVGWEADSSPAQPSDEGLALAATCIAVRLLPHRNCEIINACFFKPLTVW